MKYKFAYSLIEAACALCDSGHEPIAIAMELADKCSAENAMVEATKKCRECAEAVDCPTWVGGSPEDASLICPEGYDRPPSFRADDYLPRCRRLIPTLDEASADVVEISQLLSDALDAGELVGTPDAISRINLQTFWEKVYPADKPAIFYGESDQAAGDGGKAEIVLGALLQYLKAQRHFKLDAAKQEITEYGLGRGFSSRSLDTVFSKALETFRNTQIAEKK